MVTHDPRYARYADRTIHLFDGQVVRDEDTRKAAELEQSGFEIQH
jgi:putative ABC transport system ATP-binding protein